MTRALLVVLVYCALLVSCTEKVICPAYQSAYIYDKEELQEVQLLQGRFHTQNLRTNKNKYLIGESVPYRKRTGACKLLDETSADLLSRFTERRWHGCRNEHGVGRSKRK